MFPDVGRHRCWETLDFYRLEKSSSQRRADGSGSGTLQRFFVF